MIKFWHIYKRFLSDALLLGFAIFMLSLFILMGLSPNRCLFIGEPNLIIWIIEIVFIVSCISWSIYRIAKRIRR